MNARTRKSRKPKSSSASPRPVGKPLSRKDANAVKVCQQRFCTDYYVPKMRKNSKMYNPELRNQLSGMCSNTFCVPGSATGIYNHDGQLRNGFHPSIPTRRIKQLKRFGALSGVTPNRFIHR